MTWAKIDDRLHAHPKARRAGLEAMGLWALSLSFCAAYSTDGRIGREDVEAIGGRRAVAVLGPKLVSAGLWIETPEGWEVHDYLAYNPSSASIEAERARKVEAGRRGGLAKAAAIASSGSAGLAHASPPASAAALLPIPSRPDPGSDPEPADPPVGPPAGGSSAARTRKPRGERSEDRYAAAFEAGVRDGAPDEPWSAPRGGFGLPFAHALRAHAKDLAGPLEGDALLAWIRSTAAEWRRAAEPPRPGYAHGWAPGAFTGWLNSGRPGRAAARPTGGAVQPPARQGEHSWRVPEEIR